MTQILLVLRVILSQQTRPENTRRPSTEMISWPLTSRISLTPANRGATSKNSRGTMEQVSTREHRDTNKRESNTGTAGPTQAHWQDAVTRSWQGAAQGSGRQPRLSQSFGVTALGGAHAGPGHPSAFSFSGMPSFPPVWGRNNPHTRARVASVDGNCA